MQNSTDKTNPILARSGQAKQCSIQAEVRADSRQAEFKYQARGQNPKSAGAHNPGRGSATLEHQNNLVADPWLVQFLYKEHWKRMRLQMQRRKIMFSSLPCKVKIQKPPVIQHGNAPQHRYKVHGSNPSISWLPECLCVKLEQMNKWNHNLVGTFVHFKCLCLQMHSCAICVAPYRLVASGSAETPAG